jgi:hypothetical protein
MDENGGETMRSNCGPSYCTPVKTDSLSRAQIFIDIL